jgi:putative transposase
MLEWKQKAGTTWHFIAPGKPMQNGICEAFNGRMRDELLTETLFLGLGHARVATAPQGRRLQPEQAAGARLRDPGDLRRPAHRNGRSPIAPSAQPRQFVGLDPEI